MLPAVTSSSGRVIGGRYRLEEPLGHGGMGVVWCAHDQLLDRTVALKEVVATQGASEEVRERMLREARAAARLDHPGAVRIYDVIDEDDHSTPPWIVMEVLSGRTLKDAVNDDGPLPPPRVAEIGIALLDAVAAAHRAGILHRDVKPANVQLCDDGRVVLTDFGIAQVEGDSSITRTGDIVGSPAYMSPERARGMELGPKSDLFALGATLYAAVEGMSPFERETPIATLTAIVSDAPRPCQRAGPLAPVLNGLLDKDPERRMSEDEARDRLVAITHGEDTGETAAWSAVTPTYDETRAMPSLSPPAPSTTVRKRPRRWLGVVLLLAVLLAAGAAVAGYVVTRGDKKAATPSVSDGPFSPGQHGIPADWQLRNGPGGSSIATPPDWRLETSGDTVRFRRPSGEPYGYIALLTASGSDPVAALDDFGRQFSGSHTSYQQVSRETTKFRGADAPVLTATYEDGGSDLEASFLAVRAGSHVYILWWQAKPDGWDASQSLRVQVLSTFRA